MPYFVRSVALVAAFCSAISTASPVSRSAVDCTGIRDRVPWTNLTKAEKDAYIAADVCLINSPSKLNIEGAVTRWDDIQWPHIVQSATVHNVGAFLPFHRYYLTAHERLIKDECGYTGRMPYWDELDALADWDATDMWDEEYFGGNGDSETYCVTNGPFANLTLRFLADKSIEEHCLTRVWSQGSLQGTSQANIDKCYAYETYSDGFECFTASIHGAGHGAVSGIMVDGTLSPGDPVFYLHHAWLDKLWWEWQKLDLPNRYTDMGGTNLPFAGTQPGGPGAGGNGTALPSAPGVPKNPSGKIYGTEAAFTDYFNDNGGNITTLNHTIYMAEIYPNLTIADLMDLNGDVVCSEYINV